MLLVQTYNIHCIYMFCSRICIITKCISTPLYHTVSSIACIVVAYRIDNPLMLLAYAISLWWLATMLGMLFAVAIMFVPEVGKIKGILTRPLFFMSAVFFSIQDVPREYWPYLDWNPILHAIELSRYSAYTSYGQEGVNPQYFFSFVLTTTFIALACYQTYWRRGINK